MNHLQPPQIFEPGTSPFENWSRWRERYLNYATASGANAKSIAEQRALLLHVIGDNGYEIYETFVFTEGGDNLTPKVILDRFDEHYRPYANEIFRAHQFHSCYQQSAQSVDDYVGELKRKIKDCGYAGLQDRLVRDKLVSGIKDKALQERLLRETKLTLAEAVNMCRAAETSKQQTRAMTGNNEVTVNKIQSRAPQQAAHASGNWQDNKLPAAESRLHSSAKCRNCPFEHPPRKCPAFNKECHFCHRKGHFSSKCEAKGKRAAVVHNQLGECDSNSLDELCINTIKICHVSGGPSPWSQVIYIRNSPVTFKLDTGADVNILPIATIRANGWSFRGVRVSVQLSNYVPTVIPVIGKVTIQCGINHHIYNLTFYVTDTDTEPILGGPTCAQLSLVTRTPQVRVISSNAAIDEVLEQYSDVFVGMGKLHKQYHIHVKQNAEPTIIYPRRVPKALEAPVKMELKWLLDNNIITPVENPTKWVNPIVIVPKADGTVRICLDPVHLNKAIVRKVHYLPSVDEMFQKIKGKKIFTLLDGKKGFYMIPLDEDSSHLCTFATPYGLYRFLRLPFGVKCGPEIFQEAMEEVFCEVECADPFQDDILICGEDEQDHAQQLRTTLEAARKANVKLNVNKAKVGLTELKYLGHIISGDGIKPDPDKVKAIKAMTSPTTKQELLRLLGMTNYLSRYIPEYARVTQPLRELLKKEAAWVWDPNRQQAFKELQQAISSAPTLQVFDSQRPIVIQTDASSYGLGACMMQDEKPVAYTSTSLTKAQQGYSQIEKELLAVVHAVETWNFYTYGHPIQVHTDHKPLIGLFEKSYEQTTPRLQKMRLRLQRYDINLQFVPGKEIPVADTLSRAPCTTMLAPEVSFRVASVQEAVLPELSDMRIEAMRVSTKQDPVLSKLLRLMKAGWPDNDKTIPPELRLYGAFQDELHIVDDIICRGQRIVVPFDQRKTVLDSLHKAHRGISATVARARQHVYWPNMTSDITDMIKSCDQCARFQRSPPAQPVQSRVSATYPWQSIALDFFLQEKVTYMLCVDSYSNFVIVIPMHSTTASVVIDTLGLLFSMFGLPVQMSSDNGPPFSSKEVRTFLMASGIQWVSSSPHFPRSNGFVERMVQTIKQLLRKASSNTSVHDIVLQYNATPVSHGWSPSERFLTRHLRTGVPSLRPREVPTTKPHERAKLFMTHSQATSINSHKHNLAPLPVRAQVWFKKYPSSPQWYRGSLVQRSRFPGSYIVQAPDGTLYRRNRCHVQLYKGRNKLEMESAEQYYSNAKESGQLERPVEQQAEHEPDIPADRRTTRSGRPVVTPTHFRDFCLF